MRKPRAKAEREKNDNYPTKQALAQAITHRVARMVGDVTRTHTLIEPSAGNGSFVREMRAVWTQANINAVELRVEEEENLRRAGASFVSIMPFEHWVMHYSPPNKALLIGNPPFSLAQLHLERAFNFLQPESDIFFLLRFSFFGGKQRNIDFWQRQGGPFLKHVIPIAPRPNFVRGKSDNSEYAVYNWRVGWNQPATILEPILWENPKIRRAQNG